MLTRRFAIILYCLCCLLPATAAAQAQTVTATLRLQAKAVNVSGALVWQVDMQFTPADIVLDASTVDQSLSKPCPQIAAALRNRILKELAVMAKEETDSLQTSTPAHFYIDSIAPWSVLPDHFARSDRLFNRLGQQLNRSISRDPAPGSEFQPNAARRFRPATRVGETLAERNQTQWHIELNPMAFALVGYQLWLQTKKAADSERQQRHHGLIS